jgi:hypothetical protein
LRFTAARLLPGSLLPSLAIVSSRPLNNKQTTLNKIEQLRFFLASLSKTPLRQILLTEFSFVVQRGLNALLAWLFSTI